MLTYGASKSPTTPERRFSQSQCDNRQESNFATTSAQFNLFSRSSSSAGKVRRHNATSEAKLAHECQHNYLPDLVSLRSSAFWELRQSIADNGEGLVHRMRDYERSRSRHQIHHKAKEAEKRGRKRSYPRKKKILVDISDMSEDEDILICSSESANHILRGTFLGKRSASLDNMDVDIRHTEWPTKHARNRIPSSSPDTRYTTSSPTLESEDESVLAAEDAELFSVSPIKSSQGSVPLLSHSPVESPCSSLISLPLPSSTIDETYPLGASLSNPSTASEKAIAALNLAFANGAGSISDYSSVLQYQEISQAQSYDNGDLWH